MMELSVRKLCTNPLYCCPQLSDELLKTSVLVHQPHSNANCIKAIISVPVRCDWQLHGSLISSGMEKETGAAANHFVIVTFVVSQSNIGVLLSGTS